MSANRSFVRWIAVKLARHAALVLPHPRSPWAEAIVREVELIDSDRDALVWAVGSAWASYSERISSMGRGARHSRIISSSLVLIAVVGTLFLFREPIARLILPPEMFGRSSLDSQAELAEPIRIESGLVQGTREEDLTVYKGIPFASPPVGDLRWRAPQPAATWSGIRLADAYRSACMQKGPTLPGMEFESYSEDCLYLNVWAPAKSANEKLAVMVYIHGGGGSSGSGSARLYRSDELAKKGVVVVTFNYRLGAFGLLAHPELSKESGHNASGNYALLDDIAALRWVKRNIAVFGGDPANVTIFSHSAGAYHASQLMTSPLAQGLFRRVIAQSGGDFGWTGTSVGFPTLEQAEQTGVAFGEALDARSIAELRNVPAERILAKDNETITPGGVGGTNRTTVDGYVLPKGVHESFAEGKQAAVDLLLGYNADEGVTQLGPPLKAADYAAKIRNQYRLLANRVLAAYPAGSEEEAARSQRRLKTEDSFGWHAWAWARLHAKSNPRKAYFYYFSRVTPFGPRSRVRAAGHGAELIHVFGYPPARAYYMVEPPWRAYHDVRLGDTIRTYWTNFAKSGNPNGSGLPVWPAFEVDSERVMELGDSITARDMPDRADHELMDTHMATLHARQPR